MRTRTPQDPPAAKAAAPRVQLTVHRTVVVLGTDDRPAMELTNIDGEVKVSMLPRNGGRRSPIKLADLANAVRTLDPAQDGA